MNTKLHGLICIAFAAALSLAASSAWAADSYKFETVGPYTGASLTVRLVDTATEQPVTNAHVYVIHRQWLPPTKGGAPRYIDRRIELAAAGNGTFAYQGNDLDVGSSLRLVAHIDGSPEIEGSVHANG